MSSIVYQTNKKTGQKYAYQVDWVKDPSTGKSKQKRTYLGKVDLISGEILQKGSTKERNTQRTSVADYAQFMEDQKKQRELDSKALQEISDRIVDLADRQQKTQELFNQILELIIKYNSSMN